MFILSPSLLASDFSNLESEIKKVYMDGKGCKYLHLDVMDGVFVENISFGIPVIESIRKVCDIIFDTHLMIINPVRYIKDFIEAGADIITFHYEACDNDEEIFNTIDLIRKGDPCGRPVKCSMSINPLTPVNVLLPFIDKLDMVLIMSVEPGFGGQPFIESSLDKIKELYKIKIENNYKYDIEVDGGVTLDNLKEIKKAGAGLHTLFFTNETAAEIEKIVEKYLSRAKPEGEFTRGYFK